MKNEVTRSQYAAKDQNRALSPPSPQISKVSTQPWGTQLQAGLGCVPPPTPCPGCKIEVRNLKGIVKNGLSLGGSIPGWTGGVQPGSACSTLPSDLAGFAAPSGRILGTNQRLERAGCAPGQPEGAAEGRSSWENIGSSIPGPNSAPLLLRS